MEWDLLNESGILADEKAKNEYKERYDKKRAKTLWAGADLGGGTRSQQENLRASRANTLSTSDGGKTYQYDRRNIFQTQTKAGEVTHFQVAGGSSLQNKLSDYTKRPDNELFSEIIDLSVQWAKQHLDSIVDNYLNTYNYVLNPDDIRAVFKDVGYNGKNVPLFRAAEKILVDAVYDKILADKNVKTIRVLTGTGGSGKSFVVKNAKNSPESVIFDSAFNKFNKLNNVVVQAKRHNKKVEVVAVYNDAKTAFKNTVERGKRTGRFLSLAYFVDAFTSNQEKIYKAGKAHPDIKFTFYDNTNNNATDATYKDAVLWDYDIDVETLTELLKYIDYEIKKGNLKDIQIASIGEGISKITETKRYQTDNIRGYVNRIETRIRRDRGKESTGEATEEDGRGRDSGVGLTPHFQVEGGSSLQNKLSDYAKRELAKGKTPEEILAHFDRVGDAIAKKDAEKARQWNAEKELLKVALNTNQPPPTSKKKDTQGPKRKTRKYFKRLNDSLGSADKAVEHLKKEGLDKYDTTAMAEINEHAGGVTNTILQEEDVAGAVDSFLTHFHNRTNLDYENNTHLAVLDVLIHKNPTNTGSKSKIMIGYAMSRV